MTGVSQALRQCNGCTTTSIQPGSLGMQSHGTRCVTGIHRARERVWISLSCMGASSVNVFPTGGFDHIDRPLTLNFLGRGHVFPCAMHS